MSQWGMKTANPLVVGRRHWFISQVSRGQRPNLITWEVKVLRSLIRSQASYLSSWCLLSWKLFSVWKFLRRPKKQHSIPLRISLPPSFHSGVQGAKWRAQLLLLAFPLGSTQGCQGRWTTSTAWRLSIMGRVTQEPGAMCPPPCLALLPSPWPVAHSFWDTEDYCSHQVILPFPGKAVNRKRKQDQSF